jgi:PAS domain-containing protein
LRFSKMNQPSPPCPEETPNTNRPRSACATRTFPRGAESVRTERSDFPDPAVALWRDAKRLAHRHRSGRTAELSKTAHDITERNRTQQTLRQQADERRLIFETSQDLLMVLDSRGYLVQTITSCEATLRYRASS